MTPDEAERRLVEIARLIGEADGLVRHLGCVNMPENGRRTLLICVSLSDTKRHTSLFDKILRVAHSVENSGPHQLELNLNDDLLTQHLARK